MPYVRSSDFARIEKLVAESKDAMEEVRRRTLEIANEMAMLASTGTEADGEMLSVWIEELRELASRIK